MGMPAEAAAPAEGVASKKRLCELLGWSRMKLDRRIETDATFPVQARGTRAGGWKFDVSAVTAYLAPEDDREIVAEDISTPAGQAARIEMTARQRRDLAQAQLHEDKLRRQRAELVEAGEMRMVLGEAVTRMSTSLNKMAETLVRRLALPETALPIIRQEIDDARRQLVTGLRSIRSDAADV